MSVRSARQEARFGTSTYLLWLALGGLLIVEVLWLSIKFDTTPLLSNSAWWADLIGYSPAFLGVMFAVGAATVMALSAGGVSMPLKAADVTVRSRFPFFWLLAHLASLAAFYYLSWVVLNTDLASSQFGAAFWIVLWLLAGFLTVFCLAAAGLPLLGWWMIVKAGWQVIAIAFLIGVTGWFGGQVAEASWSPLHGPTFHSVEAVLDALGQEVVADPDSFEMRVKGSGGDFWVIVDESCSGYQGIGLVVVFLLAFFWLDRRDLRFPNVLILLPLAAVLIWILNVFRISGLLMVGAWFSGSIAMGGFHSQVGWLSFLLVSLGTVLVVNRMDAFSKGADHQTWSGSQHPEVAHLLPFVTLLTMTMLSAALTGEFDWLYPLRVIVTGVVVWAFWRHLLPFKYGGGYLTFSGLALGLVAGAVWLALSSKSPAALNGVSLASLKAEIPAFWLSIWVAFKLVGVLIMVPVAEELAFRGFLTRKLISENFVAVKPGTFTWPSFLITSLAFGILHSRWILGTLVGMLFALAYYRRGRLIDAVVAHSLANLMLTIYVWTTGRWDLW